MFSTKEKGNLGLSLQSQRITQQGLCSAA